MDIFDEIKIKLRSLRSGTYNHIDEVNSDLDFILKEISAIEEDLFEQKDWIMHSLVEKSKFLKEKAQLINNNKKLKEDKKDLMDKIDRKDKDAHITEKLLHDKISTLQGELKHLNQLFTQLYQSTLRKD